MKWNRRRLTFAAVARSTGLSWQTVQRVWHDQPVSARVRVLVERTVNGAGGEGEMMTFKDWMENTIKSGYRPYIMG